MNTELHGKYCQVSNKFQLTLNLPAMLETWVQSPGMEDPLEKGMETHSSILVCATRWTVARQATVHGVAKSQIQLNTHTHTHAEHAAYWGARRKY